MTDLNRRLGARSFIRLLGEWRSPRAGGLAGQLADRVRLLVLDGRIPLEARVPAERELADALGVSRTTVAASYAALREAGVLQSRRGAGSWTQLPADPGARAQEHSPDRAPFSPHGDRASFDLAHAAPSAPSEALRDAAAEAVHDLDGLLAGHGYDLLGLPVLRAAIARRFTARGLPTTPDQVLVTAGAQHAIALVLAELVGPGDRVLVEHPTYPNALVAITGRGGRPVPVPMAGDGWDLDLLAATVRDAAPRLAYLIPDLQNPTGAILPAADRERLVALARRTGTPLVVDETMTELALDGPLPPPVPAAPSVLAIGSASKVFWGGLRVGWIRAQAPLVRRLAARRTALDLGGPPFEQLVCARLLDRADELVPARCAGLRVARERLLDGIGELFPGWRPSRPSGGLSTWIDLGEAASSRLTIAARRHDVLLAAGPRFGVDGAFERFLRLPWTLPPDRADEALRRLALAWRGLDTVRDEDPGPVAVA